MPKVRAEFEALFDDTVPPTAYAALTMPIAVLAGDRSPQPAGRWPSSWRNSAGTHVWYDCPAVATWAHWKIPPPCSHELPRSRSTLAAAA